MSIERVKDKVHFRVSECENMFPTLGVGALLEQIESIEDEGLKQKFTKLMQHIGVIHREALLRIGAMARCSNNILF